MKGNDKISLTAEAVSLMKEKQKNEIHKHFVSAKTRRIYNVVNIFIPHKILMKLFKKRILLSDAFADSLNYFKPKQVVELGSGYSLLGFEYALNNPDCVYIESDFKDVIRKKKQIINIICESKNLSFPKNLYYVDIDVLKDDIYVKTNKYLNNKDDVLIVSEAMSQYFNSKEYDYFINNIIQFMNKVKRTSFLTNESVKLKSKKNSIIEKLLASMIRKIVRNKSSTSRFNSDTEIKKAFKKKDFSEIRFFKTDFCKNNKKYQDLEVTVFLIKK